MITANAAQIVATGGSMMPVQIAFQIASTPQTAKINCTVVRQGVAGTSNRVFYFEVAAAASMFFEDFE